VSTANLVLALSGLASLASIIAASLGMVNRGHIQQLAVTVDGKLNDALATSRALGAAEATTTTAQSALDLAKVAIAGAPRVGGQRRTDPPGEPPGEPSSHE
jgi:hypothetical protein